ncbi:hypothetical protein D043_3281B, partial [Vibrio parahaemolyticus EKP-021]
PKMRENEPVIMHSRE